MASPSSTSSPSPSSPPWRPSLCSLSSPSGTHWQGEERWRSRSRASPTSFSSQLVSTGFIWSHPVSFYLSWILVMFSMRGKTTLVPTSLESFFQSVSIGLLRTQSGSRSNRSLTSLPDISWFLYKVSCRFFNRNNIVTDQCPSVWDS